MNREILFRGKRIDNGEWVEGYYVCCRSHHYILPIFNDDAPYNGYDDRYEEWIEIDKKTLCQYTGLTDKNGGKIWEDDITKLVLDDGEVRHFRVSFKKVIRKVVTHPDFEEPVAKVELNAVCFEWGGYELFPCVDENGVSDVSKMEVIGNIFDGEFAYGKRTEEN